MAEKKVLGILAYKDLYVSRSFIKVGKFVVIAKSSYECLRYNLAMKVGHFLEESNLFFFFR